MPPNKIEEESTEPTFDENLKDLCDSIISEKENHTLNIGPLISYINNSGEEVIVKSLTVHRTHPAGPRLGEVDFIYLFAFDSTGRIVGYKHQMVKKLERYEFSGKPGDLYTNGYVETGVRGKGIASAIENTNYLILQASLNDKADTNSRIVWQVNNDNKQDLNRLISQRVDTQADHSLEAEIVKKEAEQRRWQKLYRRLGIDDRSRIIIDHQPGGLKLSEVRNRLIQLKSNKDYEITGDLNDSQQSFSDFIHQLQLHSKS